MSETSITDSILSRSIDLLEAEDPSCAHVAKKLRELVDSGSFDDSSEIEKALVQEDDTKALEGTLDEDS